MMADDEAASPGSAPTVNDPWRDVAARFVASHASDRELTDVIAAIPAGELSTWIESRLGEALARCWEQPVRPALSTLKRSFPRDHHARLQSLYEESRRQHEAAMSGIPTQYALVRPLDQGTFGEASLHRDEALGREVVIKVDRLHCDPVVVMETAEGRHMVASQSRHVAHVFMNGLTSTGRRYLVMEYLAGGTLAERLKASPQGLKLNEAVHLALQLLTGLRDAHKADVRHNDLKPANVMFDGKGELKLVDFGAARSHEEIVSDPAAFAGGTLCYLAPERWQGKPELTESDLFAVGAILFEMLTGHRCYSASDRDGLERLICDQSARSIRTLAPDLPQGLDDIVARALHRDPDQRFHSAPEFIDALRSPELRSDDLRSATASTLPGYDSDYYTEPSPGWTEKLERGLRDTGLVFLYGPPGSGKSLTSSRLANESSSPYRFWLNASDETQLVASLAVAQRRLLGLKESEKDDLHAYAKGFLESLSALSGVLLVYDNANDLKLLEKWFPRGAVAAQVLVTTQSDPGHAYCGRQVVAFNLDELEPPAAREFFLKRSGRLEHNQSLTDADAGEIAALDALFADLGQLPLAIEAAAHICSQATSIADYHAELRGTPQVELWGDEVTTATRHPGLRASLTLLFEQIQRQPNDAFRLLNEAAWLDPDAIPDWLVSYSPRERHALQQANLLFVVPNENTIAGGSALVRMHREHQFHLRGRQTEIERKECVERLVERLELPDDLDLALWRFDKSMGRGPTAALSNLTSLLTWAERLHLPVDTQGRLMSAIGELHLVRAEYYESESILSEALRRMESNSLSPSKLAAILWQQRAVVALFQATTSIAIEYVEQSLVMLRSLDLANHPLFAVSLHTKADALRTQGTESAITEALGLYDEALRIDEAAQGKSHPAYAATLHAKAGALLSRGSEAGITEALGLCDEALRIKEVAQGRHHPSYAATLHEKARALLSRGTEVDITEALRLYDEASRINAAALGKSHPSYGATLHAKAGALESLGTESDIAEALGLYDEALRIDEAALGKSHPAYGATLHAKAGALLSLGTESEITEALGLYDEALRIMEAALEKSHPRYAATLDSKALALMIRRQGADLRWAYESFDRAYQIRKTALGAIHLDTAHSLFGRGHAGYLRAVERDRRKDAETALSDMNQAIKTMVALFPSGHPQLIGMYWNRAKARRELRMHLLAADDVAEVTRLQRLFKGIPSDTAE